MSLATNVLIGLNSLKDIERLSGSGTSQHQPGEWIRITSCPEFKNWKEEAQSAALLVSGKAGSGKTVLANSMLTRLPNGQVFSFFSSYDRSRDPHIVSKLLRVLLYQICQARPSLAAVLGEVKEGRDSGVEWSLGVMKKLLFGLSLVDNKPEFYYVIDGLQEAEIEDLADLLRKLWSRKNACWFKIFLTTRSPWEVSQEDANCLQTISLDSISGNEIQKFVKREIESSGGAGPEAVAAKVEHLSGGDFSWAALVVQRLREKIQLGATKTDLLRLLTDIEKEPEKIYQSIIDLSHPADKQIRHTMFQWVLFAERTLTIDEFRVAVTLNRDLNLEQSELRSRQAVKEVDLKIFKQQIRGYCGGLIEAHGEKVELVHASARDYLLSSIEPQGVESAHRDESAHYELARTCLAYLKLPDKEGAAEELDHKDSIFRYASIYWSNHLNRLSDSQKKADLLRIMTSELRSQLLHIASESGHSEIVSKLLEPPFNADPNAKDNRNRTPLTLAARYGHKEVVESLQGSPGGIDLNPVDKDGWTPLLLAAKYGHIEVVKQLLGSDIGVKRNEQTSLYIASLEEHDNVVKELAQRTAQEEMNKLLFQAAREGRKSAAGLLIHHGANPDSTDDGGKSPWYIAAEEDHGHMINELIARQAERQAETSDAIRNIKQATLFQAVRNGTQKVVELLIAAGADKNGKDSSDDKTPLHVAMESNQIKVVEWLIAEGADIMARDSAGQTILHIAARLDRFETIAQLLARKELRKDSRDVMGQTPLHVAATCGNFEATRLLIDKGVGIDMTDCEGRTPLHAAAEHGKDRIVRYLVLKGADVTVRDREGWTPLGLAGMKGGHVNTVETLQTAIVSTSPGVPQCYTIC
jgi:ankyrin repeat protein